MRRFAIVATILLVALLGLTYVLLRSLRTVSGAVERYRNDLAAEETRLRELDARLGGGPASPDALPAPERFAAFLRVRLEVAVAFNERLNEEAPENTFHVLGTRVRLLAALHRGLAREAMRPSEYRAIARRLHALLAADPPLLAAWKRDLVNGEHPEGLPLPAAAQASGAERASIEANRASIEGSMAAEWAAPLLDRALDGA